MVLWEITLATAYWLGIRRTYRLALKLERRLIGPRHPRIHGFARSRLRNVFDIALSVHKGIQSRDLSAGKSVGNFILRFLHRCRPSAKIRGPPDAGQKKVPPLGTSSSDKVTPTGNFQESKSKLLFSQFVHKVPFGQTMGSRMSMGIGRMCPGIQDTRPHSGIRSFSTTVLAWKKLGSALPSSGVGSSYGKGVFRDDIAHWMKKKTVWDGTI